VNLVSDVELIRNLVEIGQEGRLTDGLIRADAGWLAGYPVQYPRLSVSEYRNKGIELEYCQMARAI